MEAENNKLSPQDIYEYLKEIQKEMQSEIDKLTEKIRNNPSSSLNRDIIKDDIIKKRLQFVESLKRLILKENPKNYLNLDMHSAVIQNLENDVHNMTTLENYMNDELSRIKNEVT